ncbi:hypothetical protein SEA_ZUKO_24 [Streptomyces phage Zuko]|uniref:Uncharacterized protein n=1 Tax=Streptomyces phage Zuko TaxID=2601695 RepID=A0A5J6D6U4_9CAUD|nr:virion structural protein [Streptomyces phage Zuko]QEQ93602.1 hypothetical protein SEA_ZUKO_24 [Streptomyces phage Zuko]
MTTTIAFGNTNDAYLFSGNNTYSTALAGSSLGISSTSDTTLFVGQQKSGTPYTIWQAFLQFGFVDTAASSTVAGYLRLTSSQVTGTGVSRALEINKFDWGTLTTADWRTPAQLSSLYSSSRLGGVANIQSASNLTVRAGYLNLTDLDTAATLRYVMNTSRNRLQNTPTGLEYNGFRSADYSGTDTDPALFIAEIQDSLLSRSLGAQVQLSDGSHVFLEHSSANLGNDAFTMKYRTTAGTTSNIVAISDTIGGPIKRGAQSHTIVRDSSDNLYVLYQSDTSNSLQYLTYKKNAGSWLSVRSGKQALPTADSDINNVVAAWHPAGGSLGTIVVLCGHQAGSNNGTEVAYLLLSCDYLVNGTGSLLRGSGSAVGTLIAATSIDGFHNYTNETGTLLDIAQSGGPASNTGFVMSTARHHVLGQNAGQSIARYTLNSSGTGFSEVWNFYDSFTGYSVKDANAKSRVLPVSSTQYVTVNASNTSSRGIVVKHRQQQADQFTVLAEVDLDAQGISTMPAPATVAVSNNWDAIYNPLDNKVWVYYFDATGDGRRLMRTDIDLNTGQAGLQQVEVNATVGVTGSSNLAIRVHRGATAGEQVLISVANLSGSTHSMIYVADTINVAPSQPTLITRSNFDGNTSALFDWDFHDLNSSDTQSFYQVEIYNNTTGALAWTSWGAYDNFTRSVTGGWGTADRGGSWSSSGGTVSTDYDTTGNVGRHVHTSRDVFRLSRLGSYSQADTDMTWTVTNPVLPTGDSIYTYFRSRINGAGDQYYFARLEFTTAGTAILSVRKRTPSETLLGTASSSLTHIAGQSYYVRFVTKGSTLRAKAWRTQDPEPVNWDVIVTDTDLTAAGDIGVRSYVSPTNTNTLPVVVTFDDMYVRSGTSTSNYSLPASGLPNGQDWKWRVKTWDSYITASPWSDYGFFSTSNTGVVNITDPAVDNDLNIVTANYLVRWTVSNTTQAAYNIVVTRTDTGATLVSTGWVTSTATQYLVTGMASDVEWNVALKIRNAALIESNTANRKITPNYNRPEVPVISFDIMDDLGYIGLNITNPDPVGDRPNPTVNEIHRRVYSQSNPNLPYQILGEADPNGTFLDYTAASGVLYEYRVRALAGEFFQDSTPTVADRELDLDGVWLHDPADAANTARQFLYGKDSRSHTIDTAGTVQQFAGRTFPVTDFGEYETEDITVSVDIPHGPTHRTEQDDLRGFMEMKKTLFFRDNRGRAAYGTMSGFNQADQAWGANVGFKFGRVSYDIEEV